MKLASFVLLVASIVAVPLDAQPSETYHTTLFDRLNPANAGGRFSALWGYTAPDGREYALLGGFNGTHIIDITTRPIRQVAFIDGPDNGWREMKTYGTHAYVVSEGGAGLQIIDLSNLPTSATLVKEDTRFFQTGHTISQDGHYLYVHGTDPQAGANGGTIILDVSADPRTPRRAGMWTQRYVHDATIRNDTMWASAINDGRLDVIYLGADRSDPRFVTDIRYPGAGTHNADVTTDGRFVLTTDEVGSTDKSLKVWDVSDIQNIRKVADHSHNRVEIIHNVVIKGDLAFVAWYTGGTRVIDISNPADPVEVGYFDTFPGTATAYAGNWGTYPFFASGKIISSDMQTGLHVFTFDGARRGSVSGVVRDAKTGEPVPFAVVEIPSLGRTVTADAQGRYIVTAANDTLEFRATGVDHYDSTGRFVLSSSGATMDITLRPIPYTNVTIRAFASTNDEPLSSLAWRALTQVGGTETSGRVDGNELALRIPDDAPGRVLVGAWGYRPTTVEITGGSTVIDVKLRPGYVDDVELPLGWSLAASGDDALAGRWEWGVPIGSVYNDVFIQPNVDHTENGERAYITQIAGTQQTVIGASDVDSGRTSLTSPPMDLAGFAEPTISTFLWYSRDKFPRSQSINDTLLVSMSDDGGSTWRVIDRVYGTDNEWKEFRYRVDQFMAPTANMLFRVEASDLSDQSWVEAGLDDFRAYDAAASDAAAESTVDNASVAVQPNPAGATARVHVMLRNGVLNAHLDVFNAFGERVATLHSGSMPAGMASYTLDAASLTPGHYTWRLSGASVAPLSGVLTIVR